MKKPTVRSIITEILKSRSAFISAPDLIKQVQERISSNKYAKPIEPNEVEAELKRMETSGIVKAKGVDPLGGWHNYTEFLLSDKGKVTSSSFVNKMLHHISENPIAFGALIVSALSLVLSACAFLRPY